MNTYICGDGKVFFDLETAIEHANKVFKETKIVISVEEA